MADIVDAKTRSKMMSKIKSKNTKPEITIRAFLHRQGFRFRLHCKQLPGAPDILLPKFNLAVFVHGCFWHRHQDCAYAYTPKSRVEFWTGKFDDNIKRDLIAQAALLDNGWRVLIIWECGIRHCQSKLNEITKYIASSSTVMIWPTNPPKQKQPRSGLADFH